MSVGDGSVSKCGLDMIGWTMLKSEIWTLVACIAGGWILVLYICQRDRALPLTAATVGNDVAILEIGLYGLGVGFAISGVVLLCLKCVRLNRFEVSNMETL